MRKPEVSHTGTFNSTTHATPWTSDFNNQAANNANCPFGSESDRISRFGERLYVRMYALPLHSVRAGTRNPAVLAWGSGGLVIAGTLRYQPSYLSAFSIALVSSGESGVTAGSKRPKTLPSRPIRNLVKFH